MCSYACKFSMSFLQRRNLLNPNISFHKTSQNSLPLRSQIPRPRYLKLVSKVQKFLEAVERKDVQTDQKNSCICSVSLGIQVKQKQ